MNDEIYKVIKLQNPNANQTENDQYFPSVSATTVQIVAHDLAEVICKKFNDKSKNNSYLKFVHNLCKPQGKQQCINDTNIDIYLQCLPITREHNEWAKTYHLPETAWDVRQEINSFYMAQAQRFNQMKEQADFIDANNQLSFPDGFDYLPKKQTLVVPIQIPQSDNNCNNINSNSECSRESILERSATVKFALGLINIKGNKLQKEKDLQNSLQNILEKLTKYDNLLQIEKDFLLYLAKCDFPSLYLSHDLLDNFPFVLEHFLINFATLMLKRVEDNSSANTLKRLLNDNPLWKSRAIDISYELFSLSSYDTNLLENLLNVISK